MKSSALALKNFQRGFTQHIRNPKLNKKPKDVPPKAMNVYNELLFNTIEDVLAGCFPICKDVLGKTKWTKLVRNFFTEHSCTRPFYRQVPEEFVEYLAEERNNPQDPDCLPYLAHYEWVELDLFASQESPDEIHTKGNFLEAKIIFIKPCKLLSYPYPVHEIKKGTSFKKIKEGDFYYLFYRNDEGNVDWMLLSPAQAKLIHLLLDKSLPLRKAFTQIAKELKMPEEFIIQSGMESLKEFQKKGIILNIHFSLNYIKKSV